MSTARCFRADRNEDISSKARLARSLGSLHCRRCGRDGWSPSRHRRYRGWAVAWEVVTRLRHGGGHRGPVGRERQGVHKPQRSDVYVLGLQYLVLGFLISNSHHGWTRRSLSPAVELFTHPDFGSYRLRIAEPTICDSVKQYSGYLDITTGKHLFFWFFESRHSPETADFIYWTNGERKPPQP